MFLIRTPTFDRWLSALQGLWNREFHDLRIIVEQQGDLRYYGVSAKWQRRLVRTGIVCALSAVISLAFLSVLAAKLSQDKRQLEESHRAIFTALIGSTDVAHDQEIDLSQNDMLHLAESIRDRDIAIRRYIDNAATEVGMENASLRSRLNATGLTERAIKVIQSSSAVGGSSREPASTLQPLLESSFGEQISDNRELREILGALPTQLPIQDYVLTSPFGIRKHPIHGTPRLHAGIDLISRSNDNVFPAKEGTVVLARNYNDYGKTVIVRHERGIETLYAHLDSISVTAGQEVDLATVLGIVGNTGSSTGKHLHFEVLVGGYPVDPLKVINTAQNVQQAKIQLD
jgi:murein DD-endopeptidase MepM/ murein hydrolase activator NlpD